MKTIMYWCTGRGRLLTGVRAETRHCRCARVYPFAAIGAIISRRLVASDRLTSRQPPVLISATAPCGSPSKHQAGDLRYITPKLIPRRSFTRHGITGSRVCTGFLPYAPRCQETFELQFACTNNRVGESGHYSRA